ncbi:MAG TPA: U32 family peptidase, partial [Lachnospiraceae bacterium]|nr:U32 family peptidase [Lachnospiraceae bacterium]
MKSKIELLSPAGDYECFTAAVNAGADAVYLGGNRFGARAYAQNFSDEELKAAIDYAHLFGKKVYLTINTLFKNEELHELDFYLESFYYWGLDAVIVQDIGVISHIRRMFPELPVHASTQMAITDTEGVLFLKELGIKRTVLARELSLPEIEEIHHRTDMELECFIHGALCYSYSGTCLFSSLIGGRSGNRGRCAQPCRLPYNGKYLLSTKDICTLELLPQLLSAGITSFKIEGRMKAPDYVAGVTGIYRKYIDSYLHEPETYRVKEADLQTLLQLYTRSGNSRGYYFQRNGETMISVESPCYKTADQAERKEVYDSYAGHEKKLPLQMTILLKKGSRASLTVRCHTTELCVLGNLVEAAKKQPVSEDAIKKQLNKTGGTPYRIETLHIISDPDVFIP